MKQIHRASWLVIGVLAVGLAAACGAAPGDGTAPSGGAKRGRATLPTDTIDPCFDTIAANEPGVAVAILDNGDLRYAQGCGLADLETRRPITPQTIFHIGSVGKTMTAHAIMMLYEAGQLDYDDPITRYVPELAGPGDAVTIRHLLQHTSGIPDDEDELLAAFPDGMPTNADALALLAVDLELLFAPGDQFAYSNTGYELLGTVIERVSGQAFPDFMDKHLFTPLGMTSSFSLPNAERLGDPLRARGYEVEGPAFALYDTDPLDHLVGSGSIYSTVEDLARFDQALDAHTLLAPATLAEAFTPVQLNDGSRAPYGFGWEIDTDEGIASTGHSGSWQGFQSAYRRFPHEKRTIIILTNRTDIDPDTFVFDLVEHPLP